VFAFQTCLASDGGAARLNLTVMRRKAADNGTAEAKGTTMTSLKHRSQAIPDPENGQPVGKDLTDPLTIAAVIVYVLALVGLFLTANALWPALLLGLGIAILSGVVLIATRRHTPPPVDVIRPRVELWLSLTWYGIVVLLAAFTNAIRLELVNQFTNWFFLVVIPFGLLLTARRHGLALRTTLRSVGITRTGLKDGLKLSAMIVPLFIPVLYIVGEQQQAAVEMILHKPLQAFVSFLVSFPVALLTAGFVEELFFRGVLQSRLARCTGSEWHGLLIASLLFGLFHLPMYFFSPFEPTHGNLLWALSSVITEQAVTGILLGVLWVRTHNLAAPLLVHALTNALALMTMVRLGTR
jgi:membrane protease YdiL (CAAX protease family)